jgi:luciferase family oxidoreductase group 1
MPAMIPFSILDLAPIAEGSDAGQALRNSRELAQAAEGWGYKRFWLAEHHNMPGIASAATSVAIGFVAEGTSTIRVGSGGIMLPNHSPLVIAEQFGTLAALYPDRIDLGVGRAPGTDQLTAHALRRNLEGEIDHFPDDVVELIHYFEEPEPGQRIRAVPGTGLKVPVWMLGSSTYGAQLAAMLGLPYAFASHFAPPMMEQAIEAYRRNFRPSASLSAPYVMLGFNVFAAETDEEARFLRSSTQQAFLNLRTGRPGPLPRPVRDFEATLDPAAKAILDHTLSVSAVGSPATVKAQIAAFIARTTPDELILTGGIHDPVARLRSFEIAAQVRNELAAGA